MDDSTVSLLSRLTDSMSSATAALASNPPNLTPPAHGISLLDVKNDLLLSYLQNLVFLIILKLRHTSSDANMDLLHTQLVQKLVELRVYLDRGVRPLESRLKYQIDQVLRAAEDSKLLEYTKQKNHSSINGINGAEEESAEESERLSGFEAAHDAGGLDELAHRPNIRRIAERVDNRANGSSSANKNRSTEAYKPPRITPTSMPEAADRSRGPRKRKSQLLDEYIDEELSSAPRAQPSIGSNNTIMEHGRGGMSRMERENEKERTEYEERNFIRLPGESKAERRKARLRGENNKRDMFGGEDWTGLGGLGDRVSKSVAGGRSTSGVLQRREKRRATEDSPRGDGLAIGETFEKRRRVLQGRAERKGGRKSR